jgi:TPR repeat protein
MKRFYLVCIFIAAISPVANAIIPLHDKLKTTLTSADAKSAQESNKSITVVAKSGPLAGLTAYTDSYALFIGIGKYENPAIPSIPSAPNDAITLKNLLITKFGFNSNNVQILTDKEATKKNIEKAIAKLCDKKVVQSTDRVLVFFSCHGQGITLPSGDEIGYILPYDAEVDLQDLSNVSGFQTTCLKMDELTDRLKASPAKHRAVIMDACFSGFAASKALAGSKYEPEALKKLLNERGLFVMTAGSSKEQASGSHNATGLSLYTQALVNTLKEADINGGIYTVSQVFSDSASKTLNLSQGKQNPLSDLRDGVGQMLFFAASSNGIGALSSPDPNSIKKLPTSAGLAVSATPETAIIEVDGKVVTASSTLELEPGGRKTVTVKISAPDFVTEGYEVELIAGKTIPITIKLKLNYSKIQQIVMNENSATNLGAMVRTQLQECAEAGDSIAAGILAYCLQSGLGGFLKKEREALNFAKQAATAGDSIGMYSLGSMFLCGQKDLIKDEAEALKWFGKAADAGSRESMFALGVMHENGQGGLTKNEYEASKWYRKAAEAGNSRGMILLGHKYLFGTGSFFRNQVEAEKWYRRSAEAGDAAGMVSLGILLKTGIDNPARDDTEALEWFRKAAELGNPDGMALLGVMYYEGRGGLQKNSAEATKWYRKSAEAGSSAGMLKLGNLYFLGKDGHPKDEVEAVKWFRKAAELGNSEGMALLGVMYCDGKGGLQLNEIEALKWYQKSADSGSSFGMNQLGVMHSAGKGGLQTNKAEAAKWYRKSAEAGSSAGMLNLGLYFEVGAGNLPKDQNEAIKWYRKAAKLGLQKAKDQLKRLGVSE